MPKRYGNRGYSIDRSLARHELRAGIVLTVKRVAIPALEFGTFYVGSQASLHGTSRIST